MENATSPNNGSGEVLDWKLQAADPVADRKLLGALRHGRTVLLGQTKDTIELQTSSEVGVTSAPLAATSKELSASVSLKLLDLAHQQGHGLTVGLEDPEPAVLTCWRLGDPSHFLQGMRWSMPIRNPTGLMAII